LSIWIRFAITKFVRQVHEERKMRGLTVLALCLFVTSALPNPAVAAEAAEEEENRNLLEEIIVTATYRIPG